MLLPPLCTQQEYIGFARDAGLEVLNGPKDISKDVSKTWYVFCSLDADVAWECWALTISQGHLLVAGAESLALGICLQSGERRDRVSTGIPGYEKGLCERELPVRCCVIC